MGFKKMLTFKQSKRYEFIIRSIKVTSKTGDKIKIFKVSMWDNKINDFIKVDNYSIKELNEFIFSTGFLGIKSKNRYINNFIYTLFSSDDFQERKNQVSIGATMQSINNEVFNNISVPNISESDAMEFGQSVDNLYENIYCLYKKIDNLMINKAFFLEKFFS